jgi:dethiobiotin synthetase
MHKTNGFFVTGTDTGVGKTRVTLALMAYLKRQGHRVAGFKPIASGCQYIDGQLKNEDALAIQQLSSRILAYEQINPYALVKPVAPHLAAAEENQTIDFERILKAYRALQADFDYVVTEGAGGWLVPLNEWQDMSDLAGVLEVPVVLVVAMRLGCINHARLTLRAITEAGLCCAGWVANCCEPDMLLQQENILALQQRLSCPLLAVLPYQPELNIEQTAHYFAVGSLE